MHDFFTKSERLPVVIVIACPGQGSQTPGFLQPWLEDTQAREWLGSVGDKIGVDLVSHGTTSDADTIRRTEIAQPLIVAAGIIAWNHLRERLVLREEPMKFSFAGHSVGEITAAYASGVFDADTAVRFVSERAQAMQACADNAETGMSAVLGGDPDEVIAHLKNHNLSPANFNGGGQIVAAGSLDDLQRLSESPLPKTRVMPLKVAGAFHTKYMADARKKVASLRDTFVAHTPGAPLYTNSDGSEVTNGDRYVDILVNQIVSPVRWDKCMESFTADNANALVELNPAGALSGLAKRGMPGTPTLKFNSPDDLDQAVEFILEATQA